MDLGELVDAASAADAADKCPFCGKKLHDFPKKDGNAKSTVKSKPKQLACSTVSGGGTGKWTTANHHLICAKQCYARLKPLVRMGSLVGYDVNDPPNGLGLPTLKNPYDGARWGTAADAGTKRNYGKLEDRQMQRVADWVMEETSAQWHVGHHAFEQQVEWDLEEGGEESEMPHAASYDMAVLQDLYDLWMAHQEDPVMCEEEDDGKDLKADLDNLSKEIKTAVEKFRGRKPWTSRPYFVSQRAVKYAAKVKRSR